MPRQAAPHCGAAPTSCPDAARDQAPRGRERAITLAYAAFRAGISLSAGCFRMMNTSITARELFDQQKDKLALRWLAGQKGDKRVLESGDTVSRRPSLAGYLNAVYPNKVQILGTEELTWLDSLDSRQRWETIEKIVQARPLALVISKNQSCPEDLREAAKII